MNPTKDNLDAFRHAVLANGKFPHVVAQIDCIETHMSWVFLTGDVAYKVKKPVKFGFADFSTLELRRHFCEEELRINQRFSSEIYLGVVPIGGSPGAPEFDRLPAFEYAVKMHQFDAVARMDRQLERGELNIADLWQLAARITAYQDGLSRAAPQSEFGTAAMIRRHALDNVAELKDCVSDSQRYRRFAAWTAAHAHELAGFFAERRKGGFVRDGHGDLHLENLVRIGGCLQPFDALEFDPALRYMDTLDEVALITMDLLARGSPQLGFEFLSAYLERCGDYAGIPVLRFYMFYRALVRAKVLALFSKQHGVRLGDAENRYLRVADEIIERRRPMLIIAYGLSGTGKSTILGGLIGRLHAIRLRSDVERKRLRGLPADAQSNSSVERGLYCAQSSDATYELLATHARTLLRGGYNVLVDAAFLQHSRREHFRTLAAECDAPMVIVRCVGSEKVLHARITRRAQERRDASEADLAVLKWQLDHHDPLNDEERRMSVTVNADAPQDSNEVANEIHGLCAR